MVAYRKRRSLPRRKTNIRRGIVRKSRRMPIRRRRTYNVAPSGMPRVRVARLRYVQNCECTMLNTGLSYITFNANGPFQPNGSSSGGVFNHTDPHQPMGFDQWSQLFRNYVVKGSKITVVRLGTVSPSDPLPDYTTAGKFGIYVSDSEVPIYTKSTSYKEARKGMVKYVANSQRTAQSCQAYYSPRRVYGIKDIKDNQGRLGAAVTANPTELASYVLWTQLQDVKNEAINWRFEVTIEYIIQFDEPVDLGQSSA